MRNLYKIIFVYFLIFESVYSQPSKDNYFYHGQRFGSELAFNPLTTIINGGFGIMQISNRSNKFADIDFKQGYVNVKDNLLNPLSNISDYGWQKFVDTEVLPKSLNRKKAQYFPNYSLHLVGGGATLTMFKEWFALNNFPGSTAWAYGSWLTYHLLNEVVENSGYSGVNVDPISDVYIFNILGAMLFSFDKFAGFWGNKLHLRDWSFMPAIDPQKGTIENVGQNFVIKYNLPRLEKWSFMYHFGVHGAGGLSYNWVDDKSVSVAAGLVADELVEAEESSASRVLTTDLVWTVGLFYDRNNSLMTSLIFAGTKGYKARLNVYPGLIRIGKISPGIFLNLREDNQIVTGFSLYVVPFGIAKRTSLF